MTVISAQHHPTDDVLLTYVTGGYDTAFNLVLAAHISVCVRCQNTVALHQDIGGHILEEQTEAAMSISATDLLKKKPKLIPNSLKHREQRSEAFNTSIPAILGDFLETTIDNLKWQRLSPSLRQHILKMDGKAVARLLWMAPGKAVPPHGHGGQEMTVILAGGYYDGDTAYTRGDLHFADHETPHIPIAMEDGPCLVLAATDEPLKFQSFIPRLLQPFFKI